MVAFDRRSWKVRVKRWIPVVALTLISVAVAVAVAVMNSGGGEGEERASREDASGAESELVLAFPGAEGHGRFARGGRGGQVIVVDTLVDVVAEDDGRTSLREALQVAEGPRTIVFDVGGTFDTGEEMLRVSGEARSFVTLACQSAPAPGVLIRGSGIRIHGGAHDVVMRHCAIRNIDPGVEAAENSRTIGVIGTSGETNGRMIFDHMSLGWATDENFTVFVGPDATSDLRNVTLSRSIIAEGDADSTHPESGQLPDRYLHAMGPSCSSSSPTYRVLGCSIIGNLIAHNGRRNPQMWGMSGEMLNNVVYNWHETALDARPHEPGRVDLYVQGNLFKVGPTWKTGNRPMVLIEEGGESNYRVSGNRFIDGGGEEGQMLGELTVGELDTHQNPAADFRLDCVGASRPERSPFDARVIAEYLEGVGEVGILDDQNRHYEQRPATRHAADFDADRDGVADAWERAHGLDPGDPDDHASDVDGDGYTSIEDYLAELANC